MTAARARALDTCAQAAWSQYHQVIRSTLGVPKDEIVVCGMALGYADRDAPVNALKTERTTARDSLSFRGFQE
jgi:nitroreductase